MKRKSNFLWLPVSLLLLGWAVGVGRAEEGLDLRLRLRAGQRFGTLRTIEQKIVQQSPEFGQEVNQTIAIGTAYEVLEVDEAGTAVLRCTYVTARCRFEAPPIGVVEYDSSNPPEVVPPAVRPFAALLGQSITATIAADGTVKEVRGGKQILERVLSAMELPPGLARESMKEQLGRQFDDEAMRESLAQMLSIYPDRPVAVGDSWSRRVTVSSPVPVTVENTWTLKDRRDGTAFVEVSARIKSDPEGPPFEVGPMKFHYALSGEQKGTLEIDESTGWLVRGKISQTISGEMRMETGPEAPAVPDSIPMSIETAVTIEPFEPTEPPQ